MAVLQKVRLLGNERLDLVDVENLQDFLADDYKIFNVCLFSPDSYIIKGFEILDVGGLDVDVTVASAALFNSSNGGEFFAGDSVTPNLSQTLTDNAINYVHVIVGSETLAPDARVFWDKTANNGQGAEFVQVIDTAEALNVTLFVTTGGFSALPEHIPVGRVETASGDIVAIHDNRNLFFRLGRGQIDNPDFDFPWVSGRTEPPYTINLSSASGAFLANEEITGGSSGTTATLQSGGTTSVEGYKLSADFTIGETITGGTSGETATLTSYFESFNGADKSIKGQKDLFDALATEIKQLKGTDYWFEDSDFSFKSFFEDLALSLVVGGGTLSWDGSNLTWSSDIRIIVIGTSVTYTIPADTVAIADGEAAFIDIDEGGNRGVSGNRTLTVSARELVPTDGNPIDGDIYWLAHRDTNKLYFRGVKQELEPGEEVEIGDTISEDYLTYTGMTSETDNDPNYSSTTIVTQSDDLTTAVGKLDAAVGALEILPLGSIIPHYDFNGAVSIDTNFWAYCDGSVISAPGSPIDTLTTPDLSNRYLVGFGTEGGGDIDTAGWATTAVGNASHQVNLSHSHTVDSHSHTMAHTHDVNITSFSSSTNGSHSHTVDSHSHSVPNHTHTIPDHSHDAGDLYALISMTDTGGETWDGGGDNIHTQEKTVSAWNSTRQNDGGSNGASGVGIDRGTIVEGTTAGGGPGSTNSSGSTTTGNTSPGTDSVGDHSHTIDPPNTTSSSPSAANTGSVSPGTDNQLSATTDIQPRSVRVRYIMRIT